MRTTGFRASHYSVNSFHHDPSGLMSNQTGFWYGLLQLGFIGMAVTVLSANSSQTGTMQEESLKKEGPGSGWSMVPSVRDSLH